MFLTEEDLNAAKNREEPSTVLQCLAVRERWFNKICSYHIKSNNVKQIIILGSGFDTRPCKMNSQNQKDKQNEKLYSQVKFFEVVCKQILDIKGEILSKAGVEKNAEYICADYTDEGFMEKLKLHGVNFTIDTLIIWEGNSMYHQLEKINNLFSKIKSAFKNVHIAFDYFTRDFISEPSIFTLHRQGMWKTGLNAEDLEKLALQTGFNIIATDSIATLEKQYEVNSNPPPESEAYKCSVLRNY